MEFTLHRGRNCLGRFEEDFATKPKMVSNSRKDEDSDEKDEEQGWVEVEKGTRVERKDKGLYF